MNVSEFAALGGLVIAVIVASISAWSVVNAARRQAEAALDAARHQTMINQEVAVFQIQATLTSANKQRWMETFRMEFAELVSEIMMLQAVAQAAMESDVSSLAQQVKRTTHLASAISLLLDADQPSHVNLRSALQASLGIMTTPQRETFGPMLGEIMHLGRQVLKDEAERLQRLVEFTSRSELAGGDRTTPRLGKR